MYRLRTPAFLLASCIPLGVIVWMRLKASGDPSMGAGMAMFFGYILAPWSVGSLGIGWWGISIYRDMDKSGVARWLIIAAVVLAFLPVTWVLLMMMMDDIGII